MSFSGDVRRELTRVPCEKKCCAGAELTGVLLAGGGLAFRGFGRYGVSFSCDGQDVASRLAGLLKRYFYFESEIVSSASNKLGGVVRYSVIPTDQSVVPLLRELRLLDKNQPFGLSATPMPGSIKNDCCKRAFLRGVFLAVGRTGDPRKAYHLEFSLPDEALATYVQALLQSYDLPMRILSRKGREVVYLKDSDQFAHLLTLIGAHQALLALENVRIVKELRNEVNRQTNCDNANVDKTLAAAERQTSIIEAIECRIGLDELPSQLREIALLRLQHPEASLIELGALASPPVGKSGVNARMRKLQGIAEELVNKP